MPDPLQLLGGLTAEAFLRDYWQQRPLLVRGALPALARILTPDELAGLATEDDVTARLVLESGGAYPWELRYGPFDPDDFADLPETHWTLLVQEVDRFLPDVADLLGAFRFLPNWRLDDVMVSYATPHGGVGAHVDNYDVFLLQGVGRRRWQIGHTPVQDETLVPDLDVRMLADFTPDAEWVLEPGDLLYLPPRLPHYGVAVDACMTFSVGLRAPSDRDLGMAFLEHLAGEAGTETRYTDAGLRPTDTPGLLDAEARARLRALLRSALANDDTLDTFLGTYLTTPRRGALPPDPDEAYDADTLYEALADDAVLRRVALPHLLYTETANGRVTLYAGGIPYPLPPALAFAGPLLTGTAPLDRSTLQSYLTEPRFTDLLLDLLDTGVLWLDQD